MSMAGQTWGSAPQDGTGAGQAVRDEITVATFRLGGQMMAIPASALREILDPLPVTRVPTADRSVWGVINVRGAVVPLAELRHAFGMAVDPVTSASRMMVLDVDIGGEPVVVAITADAVTSVITLDRARMERLPASGSTWPAAFVQGLFRSTAGVIVLPDLTTIFAAHAAAGAASQTPMGSRENA